jgi:hypothetical protein
MPKTVPPERQTWNDEQVALLYRFRELTKIYYDKIGATLDFGSFRWIADEFQTIDLMIHGGNQSDEQILDQVINFWRGIDTETGEPFRDPDDDNAPRLNLDIAIAYCLGVLKSLRSEDINARHETSELTLVQSSARH